MLAYIEYALGKGLFAEIIFKCSSGVGIEIIISCQPFTIRNIEYVQRELVKNLVHRENYIVPQIAAVHQ